MSRKKPKLLKNMADIFKPDPVQDEKIRRIIRTMVYGQPVEEETGLISDREWRAWMDRIEAGLSRLEEYVFKLGITEVDKAGAEK